MDAVDVQFYVHFDGQFDVVDVSYPVLPLMGRWAPSAPIGTQYTTWHTKRTSVQGHEQPRASKAHQTARNLKRITDVHIKRFDVYIKVHQNAQQNHSGTAAK